MQNTYRGSDAYVKIKGRWYYLYRAIDKYGHTLDWMLSRQQNAKAALRFFKKAIAGTVAKNYSELQKGYFLVLSA
ncbi:transposase (plasmid) [Piscirickettsia salmonis]|uniref:Transposase n=1 Tax=Piscirickettsia salmonis TaxID=1238 RepID=A0AAC8VLF8_PISSA|nr:transposase [Piscirickettsia salmonis]QGO71731.1 hypothetical protein Psal081_03244 [Piscirickettsia salmonis]QGO92607.1 hypothetical protein Psal110_03240 [Piscirickettsia salmonis]